MRFADLRFTGFTPNFVERYEGADRRQLTLRFAYFSRMRKSAFEPCIPTPGKTVPSGAGWLHDVKHDGYRLIVQRDSKRVRLFTRNGHDWSDRFPLITEAALRNRISSFVIMKPAQAI